VFIDTHCHLDLSKFDADRADVLLRAQQAGIVRIVIPGLTLTSSLSVIRLAQSHPMLFAAVGIHPTEAGTWTDDSRIALKNLITPSNPSGSSESAKIVAIGEIGLDYYWNSAPHEVQKNVLRNQLELAAEMGLPVILHMREAKDMAYGDCASDLLQILAGWVAGLRSENNPLADRPGVLHSFSGSQETARAALELGFFIGVTGPVTFENARARQEIVAALPLERILIETDAPFLAPHPYRGKRNEPAHVRLIARKIALLNRVNIDEVGFITSRNAANLFAWEENGKS
jgi:TatD DNase family protein